MNDTCALYFAAYCGYVTVPLTADLRTVHVMIGSCQELEDDALISLKHTKDRGNVFQT